MGVDQVIKEQEGNKVSITVVTDKGNTATGHYYTNDSDSTIDDITAKTTETALAKD